MSPGSLALRSNPLPRGGGLSMALLREGRVPGWGEALALLRTCPAFVDALGSALAGAPFEAFLWETPPVSAATRARPFEWVVIESRRLASVATDDLPFAPRVRGERGIRTFENLSGDAMLVVPCAPGADPRPGSHAHLAAFVRGAPRAHVRALWAEVARATERRLASSPEPCWVSTSGLGVSWVHVRIDERPKYFAHAPFRANA